MTGREENTFRINTAVYSLIKELHDLNNGNIRGRSVRERSQRISQMYVAMVAGVGYVNVAHGAPSRAVADAKGAGV